MSQEFIEFLFPCHDCLVQSACRIKPEDEPIKKLQDQGSVRCLAMPKTEQDVTYIKTLIECWANLGVRIINNMQKTEDPETSREKHNNIPMQYIMLMGQISYLLQWMINSTSWDIGELQDFDTLEIRNKCNTIKM